MGFESQISRHKFFPLLTTEQKLNPEGSQQDMGDNGRDQTNVQGQEDPKAEEKLETPTHREETPKAEMEAKAKTQLPPEVEIQPEADEDLHA